MERDNPRTSRVRELHSTECAFALSSSGASAHRSCSDLYVLGDWALYTVDTCLYLEVLRSPSAQTRTVEDVPAKAMEDGVVAVKASAGCQFAYFLTRDGILKAVSEADGFVYTICDLPTVTACEPGDYVLHVDESNELVIALSHRQIVTVTLDVDRIILSQGCMQHGSVPCEFDATVDLVSVWGPPQCSELFLVFAGKGASLYSMKLAREGERGTGGGKGGGWSGLESTLGTDVDDSRDHRSWITALSDGCCGVGLSGDATGGVNLWRFDEDPAGPGDRRVLSFWYNSVGYSTAAIVCISADCMVRPEVASFWSYDADGVYVFCEVERIKPRLTKLRRLTETPLGALSQLMWTFKQSTNVGHLRAVSRDACMVVDRHLNDAIATQYCVTIDPPRRRGHRSLVTCVTLVRNCPFMVVGLNNKTLLVYDYVLGQRRSNPLVQPKNASSVACFPLDATAADTPLDATKAQGGAESAKIVFKMLVGLESGVLQEILVEVPTRDEEVDEEIQAGIPSMDDGSILDVLETDVDAANPVEERRGAGAHALNGHGTTIGHAALDTAAPEAMCSFKLINKAFFCPWAVMKIFYSSKGAFAAVCFGKSLLILYESKSNKQVTHIDMDASVSDVSVVESISKADIESDGELLTVALRGGSGVKLLDLMRGKVTESYNMCPDGSLTGAALWHVPGPRDASDPDAVPTRKTFAVYSDQASNLLTMTVDRRNAPRMALDGNLPVRENADNISCGMSAFQAGGGPIVSSWTYRHLICLGVDLNFETYDMRVRKAHVFQLVDMRVRVMSATSLERTQRDRSTRLLVVLSDGTVTILSL